MSEENVEIVRAIYERWREGDYSATDWADPRIEFVIETPGGGSSRGVEGMRDSWRDFLRTWEEFRAEVQEIIDAGDQVLVLNEFGGRGRGSGVPIGGMMGAALFTFENGKVVRLTLYGGDWDRARAAAGLSE